MSKIYLVPLDVLLAPAPPRLVRSEVDRVGELVIDEVGYIPFDGEAANLFFQLISAPLRAGVGDRRGQSSARVDTVRFDKREPVPSRTKVVMQSPRGGDLGVVGSSAAMLAALHAGVSGHLLWRAAGSRSSHSDDVGSPLPDGPSAWS